MSLFIRKNERREIRRALSMTCQVVRERDFKLVSEQAIDVSPDGMQVLTDAELRPGENLIVSFRATETGIWFDTEAEVARVIHGRRPGDRGKAIGVRFSTLSRVQRFILRNHLRRTPPPVPRRTQRIDWAATVRSIEA